MGKFISCKIPYCVIAFSNKTNSRKQKSRNYKLKSSYFLVFVPRLYLAMIFRTLSKQQTYQ